MNLVTLWLPAKILKAGNQVGVAWQGLQDLQGRDVSGTTTVTAR